ncbi:glycoside hydrolase family 27 protein [Olivibacter ginsenosidimutans]|uniref:Alpha-galactosidase n=1 Tax=Olivibacter ginsenosidimutans TaxID=1176537 RepID=A0ABP9ATS3_9SPHI
MQKKLFSALLLWLCCQLAFGQQPEQSMQEKQFKKWAQTPPMGWNSWDCYGPTVEEHEVKANADYMAKYLKPYGWEYVVVDIRWYVANDKAGGYNQTDPIYLMDRYGRYQPAENRFPSAKNGQGFKALAQYIHQKGLKFGIHIMRGIPKEAVAQKTPILGAAGITADQIYSDSLQCEWLKDNYTIVANQAGAQAYYNSIINLYASWRVDFIKVDDLSRPYHADEIALIRKAIDQCGRPMVFSTSPGETPIRAAAHVREHANMWRMVDDVWDTWDHVKHLFDVAQQWYPYIAPGTWPDCDMIPLGRIAIRGERGADRMTRLSPEEQYSLMNLFSIFKSPLMFGGDLPSNDPFTLSLLTNKEVLTMHREGDGVKQLFNQDGKVAITSTNKRNGDTYLAIFNLNDGPDNVAIDVPLDALGLQGKYQATNLWNTQDRFLVQDKIRKRLKPHSSLLVKLQRSN